MTTLRFDFAVSTALCLALSLSVICAFAQSGKETITIAPDGKHSYDLEYTLPAPQ